MDNSHNYNNKYTLDYEDIIFLLLGFITAKIYSYFILPNKHGETPLIKLRIYPILYNSMIIIPINNKKAIHIHHWLIYLLICLLVIIINIPKYILGFSIGLFIQGIKYKDSYNFICDNPWNIKNNLMLLNIQVMEENYKSNKFNYKEICNKNNCGIAVFMKVNDDLPYGKVIFTETKGGKIKINLDIKNTISEGNYNLYMTKYGIITNNCDNLRLNGNNCIIGQTLMLYENNNKIAEAVIGYKNNEL